MKLFSVLDLETSSYCHRRCPTCLRNSNPAPLKSWFEKKFLPERVIYGALRQAKDLGFDGTVLLSHFNEPLLDPRLPSLARLSSQHFGFRTAIVTTGEVLTDTMAQELDGLLGQITVSLYDEDENKKRVRATWLQSLFRHTRLELLLESTHLTTHYSPNPNLKQKINQAIDTTCTEPQLHCIINHQQQFLMCCEDGLGNFGLGQFPEISLEQYWYGEPHASMLTVLSQPGGRRAYSYCSICPK